jgi:hypothetical protein
MSDDDDTILIPVVGGADASPSREPATVVARPVTGTRRERRLASRRTGGSWPWLLYALVVAVVIAAAAALAVEGVA